jgi:hypothetical protein
MNRNLGIEREYTLGEYQTYVLLSCRDLPEDVAFDPDVVDVLGLYN